jgi:hypothetical protein
MRAMRADKYTTRDWLYVATVRVIADTGFLTKADRAALDRESPPRKNCEMARSMVPQSGQPGGNRSAKNLLWTTRSERVFR